jgi:hypothetical protein
LLASCGKQSPAEEKEIYQKIFKKTAPAAEETYFYIKILRFLSQKTVTLTAT